MRRVAAIAIASSIVATLALGHGASKGLHLHVSPDPAARGGVVTVEIDAAEAMRRLRLGFVGSEPLAVELDPPSADATFELEVPFAVEGETINLHAEAVTVTDRVLRAAAVVRLAPPPKPTP